MVRKVSVVITDDLDGSPGAGTVSFGHDGVSYEIDLGQPAGIGSPRQLARLSRPAGG